MNTLLTGIAPEHMTALVAALLLPFAVRFALGFARRRAAEGSRRADRSIAAYDAAPLATKVTAYLLLTTGVIHFALPFGHNDAPMLTLMFLGGGVAFIALALRALGDKAWRGKAAFLLSGSILAYLVIAGSGWQEEPDQVGIATKLIELTALGLIVIPAYAPAKPIRRRLVRPLASTAFVALTVVTGTTIWIGSFLAHSQGDAEAAHSHEPGTPAHSHGHSHAFAARAQAGVIIRPDAYLPPTLEQAEAADRLARETRDGIARYQDVKLAEADGYKPSGPRLGGQVHYENKPYKKDGITLDATRPELLVYGFEGERYILLGAVYVMETAGEPGPAIGGSITRWHTHNICATAFPPGFSLVSPFGSCPLMSVAVTLPEMMHVWTVEHPGGPYAEGVDEDVVRKLLEDKAQ